MSEWLGCESIVRQREKEQHAAALAKCASGASVGPGSHQDSTISTDVSAGARVAWTWFEYRFTDCMCFSLQSTQSSSSSSEKQSHVGLHSDSNSSTQVKTQPVSLLSQILCMPALYLSSLKHRVSSCQTVWIQSCKNNVVQPRSCDLWICLVRYLTFNLVASKKKKYFL